MIILSDVNNKVVGSFVDGTVVTELAGVADLPMPETQVGKDAVLVIDTATKTLSYNYADRPLTDAEQQAQDEAQQANIVLALVKGGLM